MRDHRGRWLSLLLGLWVCLGAGPSWGDEVSRLYDALVLREQGMALAETLRVHLRGFVPLGVNNECLWDLLVGNGKTRDRAAAGLYLLESLCPGGDLSRWEEAQGWWLPRQIPVPLTVADGVLLTATLVARMPDPGGPWLALSLLERFWRSDRARYFFGRVLPAPVAELEAELQAKGVAPTFGWPQVLEVTGTLPVASPLYGDIRLGRAMAANMTFLDGMGRPTGGVGSYAWDRPTGRIYRVLADDPALFPLVP